MTPKALNDILGDDHPAAAALLSPFGRRAAMPLGIPQQAEQASKCVRKATIGEITNGAGVPLTLPSIARYFTGLDPKAAFRYAPQAGHRALREAWATHLLAEEQAPMSLPVVTSGITHGLSICADLFVSPGMPVLLPTPYWDNYEIIYTMKAGAELRPFAFYDPATRGFNVAGLAAALAALDGPAALILNFPSNPTGYAPTHDEAAAIVRTVTAHRHPLLVVCDDAYHGLLFTPEAYPRSLFGALARAVDPALTLVARVDGATKELVFFGGRVGFLTFSATGRAGEALAEKAATAIRSTVSSGSAPAQAAVLQALQSPTLAAEQASIRRLLHGRFDALQRALASHRVPSFPFNGGCFALLPMPPGSDCEEVRQRLIATESVGTIAVPSANALRLAFCSMEEADIEDLVARVARALG